MRLGVLVPAAVTGALTFAVTLELARAFDDDAALRAFAYEARERIIDARWSAQLQKLKAEAKSRERYAGYVQHVLARKACTSDADCTGIPKSQFALCGETVNRLYATEAREFVRRELKDVGARDLECSFVEPACVAGQCGTKPAKRRERNPREFEECMRRFRREDAKCHPGDPVCPGFSCQRQYDR
jgi:hypothetical protein